MENDLKGNENYFELTGGSRAYCSLRNEMERNETK